MKTTSIISWVLQVVVAVILLQTLFFKFTGAAESVALFEQLGMEPAGRILTGIAELIAGIAILVPGTIAIGAILGFGLMTGAIIAHVTVLGFAGDNGSLAALAIVAWIACIVIAVIRRKNIPVIGKTL